MTGTAPSSNLELTFHGDRFPGARRNKVDFPDVNGTPLAARRQQRRVSDSFLEVILLEPLSADCELVLRKQGLVFLEQPARGESLIPLGEVEVRGDDGVTCS